MPKDNENIPWPIETVGPSDLSRPQPFTPEELVPCAGCGRVNPPTRANCLYCGHPLPSSGQVIKPQETAVKQPEKGEHGYNNIHVPRLANSTSGLSDTSINEAAAVLGLTPEDLSKIIATPVPLPVSRTAASEDASHVQHGLSHFGIQTIVIPDDEIETKDNSWRVRALQLDDDALIVFQTPETSPERIAWGDLALIVVGRIRSKRTEIQEHRGRRETRIVDASDFFDDETVVDFFIRTKSIRYRITARTFDFSCLGQQKSLRAEDNVPTLTNLLQERAGNGCVIDDAYNSVRKLLDLVWPTEQQTEYGGRVRGLRGKFTVGSSAISSNDGQFIKYGRLRYHFVKQALPRINEN